VTSQFPTFVFHRSNAFLQVICLMVLAVQLNVLLHAESRVTCRSVLKLRLCFARISRASISLLMFESVILLVYSLYAKDIEPVKLRPTLLASTPELISIISEINAEGRISNHSQSVN
jgi:hypothetical protein